MSGGIDSSGAALILKQAGRDLVGLTARMWGGASKCCGEDDIYHAQRVCHKLDIPHHVLNLTKEFDEHVVSSFVKSYLDGLTPNPCAACNREIKFGRLVEAATRFGLEHVASGHYASLDRVNGSLVLTEPADRPKSQIYFLSLVRREVLPRLEFPLSDLRKGDVKEMVKAAGLPARETESQDLCFVTSGRYDEILRSRAGGPGPGDVLDTAGNVVARHKGHVAYTVGQRFGLRGKRHYVLRKCADRNEITIGDRAQALARKIRARSVNYFLDVETEPGNVVLVKYRYNSPVVRGSITEAGRDRLTVLLGEPCFAPAAGQILACYRDDHLICGGIIETTLE